MSRPSSECAKKGKLIYDEPSKFAWLLIAGTVVVGLMGLIFEKKLRQLFEDPTKSWIVAAVLVVNGLGMVGADILKRRASEREKQPIPAPSPGSDPAEQRAAREAGEAIEDDESNPAEDAPTNGARRRI